MPWKCPACYSQILHHEFEEQPSVGASYRCHICRLDLVLDPTGNRLTVAPMIRDDENQKLRTSS